MTKQKSRSGKDDAGCMWGFIGMLAFRRKPPKLLLDGNRGSDKPLSGNKDSRERCDLLNRCRGNHDDLSNTTSIKMLIEEEMSTVYHSKRIQRADSKRLCSENDVCCENDREILTRDAHSHKTPTNLVSHQSWFQNILEVLSGNINLSAALQKFYDDNYKNQNNGADCKDVNLLQNHHLVLQKTLHEELEPIYKFSNITSNGMLKQSDEFLKVLEVIGSDKDMFLNYLQDPNAYLLKHTAGKNQNPPLEKQQPSRPNKLLEETVPVVNTTGGSSKQEKESASQRLLSHKQKNIRNIFRKKKKKSQSEDDISCGDQSSKTLDKIVLLKPITGRRENAMRRYNNSPNSSPRSPECLRASMENEKVTSGFSFRELKKRLRNAIRESKRDDHLVSSRGVLNKIPSKVSVATKNSYSNGESSQLANGARKKDKIASSKRYSRKSDIVEKFGVPGDGCRSPSATKPCHLVDREGNFQWESKKHLLELLEYRIDGQQVPARHVHKSLEKLVNMPESSLSSPRTSPARYRDPCLSPRQMRFSPIWSPIDYGNTNRHGLLKNNLLSSPCTTSYSNNVLQKVDSKGLVKEHVQDDSSTGETSTSRKGMFSPPWSLIQDNRTSQGCTSSTDERVLLSPCAGGNNDVDVKALDSTPDHLDSQIKDTPSEKASSLSGIMDVIAGDTDLVELLNSNELGSAGPGNTNERYEDDESASTSRSDTAEEKSRSLTTSVPIGALCLRRKNADDIIEKPERPSPISVLEPPILDDAVSPDIADLEHDGVLPISPRDLHFNEYDDVPVYHQAALSPEINRATCMDEEEFKHEYIISLLEASGLSSQEAWEGLQFSHQLLHPALYDEVETPNGDIPDNLKLLFDSINEVLVNIHRRYISCMLGVYSARHHRFHTFPSIENIVQEISKGTNSDFNPETPSTLYQIVQKDIHFNGWLTTVSETEDVTNSIGDVILEEILQEMVHEMWY